MKKKDVCQYALCKMCQKTLAVKCSSSTNIFHHLRTNHTKECEDCIKLCDSSTANSGQQNISTKYTSQAFNKLSQSHSANTYHMKRLANFGEKSQALYESTKKTITDEQRHVTHYAIFFLIMFLFFLYISDTIEQTYCDMFSSVIYAAWEFLEVGC